MCYLFLIATVRNSRRPFSRLPSPIFLNSHRLLALPRSGSLHPPLYFHFTATARRVRPSQPYCGAEHLERDKEHVNTEFQCIISVTVQEASQGALRIKRTLEPPEVSWWLLCGGDSKVMVSAVAQSSEPTYSCKFY